VPDIDGEAQGNCPSDEGTQTSHHRQHLRERSKDIRGQISGINKEIKIRTRNDTVDLLEVDVLSRS